MRNDEFSQEEVEVMRDVIRRSLQELKMEVLHTDTHNFKTILRERQALLESALDTLSSREHAPA